jgi:hypothetical protein
MLTPAEKQKLKAYLSEGLNIRPDINLPYFLDAISSSKAKILELESKLNEVLMNQRALDNKLNWIINVLGEKR